MGQQIVEFAGALADQMREHLALLLALPDRGRARARSDRIAAYRASAGSPISPSFQFQPLASRAGRPPSKPIRSARRLHGRAQHRRTRFVVDDDRAEQDVVQQPPPLVEEGEPAARTA